MIVKEYDPSRLSVQDAAAVLEVDSTYVSRLIRKGQLSAHQDNHNRKYVTEADVRNYLTSRLPSGYVATLSEDHLTML